tara:strand:+ start:2898 stop:3572 length:675 start_codon:yes stop_codon:yes gene_type:complete
LSGIAMEAWWVVTWTTADFGDCSGVRLIETLRWDGAGIQHLALHLARLRDSAQRLGFACDPAAAAAALHGVAPVGRAARMRLTLDAMGGLTATAADLPMAQPVWRLGLASARLRSDDPWLSVKSTRRAIYDDARALLPQGLDEVIFLNERGEVCDGTITSVFFDTGSGLFTPPLRCGLLPGVLRAEMLARGQLREAVLDGADLATARLWVGNSLRGLIPAIWVG